MNAVFHLSIIWISGKIRFPSMLNRTTIGYERDKFIFGKDKLLELLDPLKRTDVSKRQTPEVLEFKKDKNQKHNVH